MIAAGVLQSSLPPTTTLRVVELALRFPARLEAVRPCFVGLPCGTLNWGVGLTSGAGFWLWVAGF